MMPYDPEHDDDVEYDLERFLYEVNQDRDDDDYPTDDELEEMHSRFVALFS